MLSFPYSLFLFLLLLEVVTFKENPWILKSFFELCSDGRSFGKQNVQLTCKLKKNYFKTANFFVLQVLEIQSRKLSRKTQKKKSCCVQNVNWINRFKKIKLKEKW
jgi:hypothetical protein